MYEDKQLESLCWDYTIEEENEDVSKYTADFETTTKKYDCRVWAWSTCEIGNPSNKQYGNSIESFIEWCTVHPSSKIYFHNLKFDGSFILNHILMNGWEWIANKNARGFHTFTTLISDMAQFYSIKLYFEENMSCEFLDSLKVIPLPVAKIPKAFGLPIEKLDLDYEAEREIGHEITEQEKKYISNDVEIVALAMDTLFNQDLKKMTAGSNALCAYKKSIGGTKRFRDWFPEPSYDELLRKGGCYKGGFTAANPKQINKVLGEGISFDVNSLYPSVMCSSHGELLPYGEPLTYEGEYVYNEDYPLYIQFIEVDFTIKENFIPCLQLKGNNMFSETEYITDSKGLQTICVTSVDLALLLKHYTIHDIRYLKGYMFKGSSMLFKDYVSHWSVIKIQASINGNEGLRTIAKLMMNSLYGKFATNPVKLSKKPVIDDEIVKYVLLPEEYTESVYLPVGAFITAYARSFTITAAQDNYDRWIYCDTDSLYLTGTEPPKNMHIDDNELGLWKQEHIFTEFKVLRAKTYIFREKDELTIHCAGMPVKCHQFVDMDNFSFGSSFAGKLAPKQVKGGIILEDTVFTIKRKKEENNGK